MKHTLAALAVAALVTPGCALDPAAGGGAFHADAARVHVYTPQEQDAMTADGALPTMMTPSEIRDAFSGRAPATKPTGEVHYCDAGLSSLVQARRNQALAAIDAACGGKDRYAIRREGPGDLKARWLGHVRLTPECMRSRVIVFRCAGEQPRPDMRR